MRFDYAPNSPLLAPTRPYTPHFEAVNGASIIPVTQMIQEVENMLLLL
jgi:hypothetical protein